MSEHARNRYGFDGYYEPLELICEKCNFPQIGNQYVIVNRKNMFLSLGPHWTGPFYVTSLTIMFTLFYNNVFAVGLHPAFAVMSVIFCILVLVFLFLTSCSDPGIVQRQSLPTSDTDPTNSRPYCDSCQCYQNPRTVHCDDCGVCIEGHDHHCIWMSKCIGKRNMKYFIGFNASWIVYLVFFLITAVVKRRVEHK